MQKLQAYAHLLRVYAPTGYMLLFLPCLFGLGISITKVGQLWYVPLFFAGSLVMRSAGCIINDICDRKIDARVDRTRNRPLATGVLSIKEALAALCILMLIGLAILMTLSTLAIIIGLYTIPLIIIYPLLKRITYFPQVLLGLTFGGAGVLIAFATITSEITMPAILVYIGCVFWTLGYDCIYAFMDMEDDRKIRVKSIAIFLYDRHYKVWITFFYVTFILLILSGVVLSNAGLIAIIGIIIALLMLFRQVSTLDIESRENCMERFKNNSYVGLVIGVSVVIERLWI